MSRDALACMDACLCATAAIAGVQFGALVFGPLPALVTAFVLVAAFGAGLAVRTIWIEMNGYEA